MMLSATMETPEAFCLPSPDLGARETDELIGHDIHTPVGWESIPEELNTVCRLTGDGLM
jgi:hypothetical protein